MTPEKTTADPPARPARKPRSLLLTVEGLTEAVARSLPSLAERIARGALSELAPPLPGSRTAALGMVMTGAWPDQHGMVMPVVPTETGRRVTEAGDRQRPALWEVLGLHGVPGIAVGWPASAPGGTATAVVDAAFGAGSLRSGSMVRMISPPSLIEELAECWMGPEELDLAALASLVPAWEKIQQDRDPRLAAVADAVASSVSRHAAFLELLGRNDWESAALLLQLPAELAKLEATVTNRGGDEEIFTGLAERGLALLDAFLAAILEPLADDVRVLVCGVPDAERGGHGSGGPGFLLLHGPGVTPGAKATGASLLDVVPTIWRLHGWAAAGTAGRPLVEVMQDYPLIRNFSLAWSPPALLPAEAAAGEPSSEHAAWRTRWLIFSLQIRASSLMARAEWISAMPLLERQLALQPDSVALLALLVECQYFAGLYREALANAWDVLDLSDPEDPVPLLMVAGLEAITGDFPKGRRFLDEAAPLVRKRPAARLFQGRVLIHLRQWQEAKAVLEALIADEPRNAAALGQLARAHLGLQDWPAACEIALQATALNLQDATVHEILGTALLKMGLTAEAWSAFKAATDITPSWPRPWARLAHLGRQLGRSPEEIARLTARYHAAVRTSRDRRRAYLDSVKAALPAPAAGSAPTPAVPTITGLVALSGTDPALLREIAEATGRPVVASSAPEPVDPFWQPLLDSPAARPDFPLEAGTLYLMPPAVPSRLPLQYRYRLLMVFRPLEEIPNQRAHLPRSLARLSHEDLVEALRQERSALAHLAEFSPNLTLTEISAEDLRGSGMPPFDEASPGVA